MRRTVKVMPSLVAAFLSVIVLARPASSALCARWESPEAVVVGTPVSLSFRTYVPVSTNGDDYTLEPHAFPDYPFRVRASAPDGTTSKISMAPDPEDDQTWVGSFTPDRQGRWTLSITNLQGGDAVCYSDATLVVEQDPGIAPWYFAVWPVVILAGLTAFVLARRRRIDSPA